MWKKLKKFFKQLFTRKKKKKDHIRKADTYAKDVRLGRLEVLPASDLRLGVRLLGPHGIAHIKEVLTFPWIRVNYLSGRTSDHKKELLHQYFFTIMDNVTEQPRVYPLSYSDYLYIDPCEADRAINGEEIYLEGHITRKQYFQLLDATKEQREHLDVFNASGMGRDIWRKLKSKSISSIKIN